MEATPAFWSSSSNELTLAADQLHASLRSLSTADPFRLAEMVAHMRRRSPDRYHIVAGALRTFLQTWSAPSELAKTALELACQSFDTSAPDAVQKIAPLFDNVSLGRLSALFRTHFDANVQVFLSLLDAYLDNHAQLTFGPRAQLKLAALAYIHASDEKYARLMAQLHMTYGTHSDVAAHTAQKGLFRVTTARVQAAESHQRLAAPKQRLRIALCVSGQMRAFRTAWPTWKKLGFFEHDVDIFVHTWRSIGWRFPNPQSGNGTERAFAHLPFRHAYVRCGTLYGTDAMWAAYPTFMQTLARDCGEVTEADIRAVYGEQTAIVIEDDPGSAFEPDPKNQRKMFHKIQAAHAMARASGQDYDLIVRMRPDRGARQPSAPVNLAEMARISAEHFCIFGEPARISNAMYVDDQFALGIPAVMDRYAQTPTVQEQAHLEKWYGFTPELVPHLSLAQALFFQGVRVKAIVGARLGPILGDEPMSRDAVRELLLLDISKRTHSRMDAILLDALT